MYNIFPLNYSTDCPSCQASSVEVKELIFQGKFILADCLCSHCGVSFYKTLPFAHSLVFPFMFSKIPQKSSENVFPTQKIPWLHQPLLDAVYQNLKVKPEIGKEVYRAYHEVVLLHCLDETFGHIFFRLLNAQQHLQTTPEIGLIVLIPKSLQWLVPTGVAEIWWIDTELKNFVYGIENLQAFVEKEFQRFDKVHLSPAFVQPDLATIDISLFTKVKRFDLADFLITKPRITLIYREDRFWVHTQWDTFLNLVWLKYKKKNWIWEYLQQQQLKNFIKTARIIRKQLPQATFFITGLGKKGKLPDFIQDKRTTRPDELTEKKWLEIYAQSHAVIGVHGSNLLLPSALSAGCIELLPDYKIPNYVEANASPYSNRWMSFLYRTLPLKSKPKNVAQHAVQMIKGFRLFYVNIS
jgi:hypothetical protein